MSLKSTKLKNLPVSGLLLIVLFSQLGYHIYYQYARYEVKKEMMENIIQGLPDSTLDIISCTDNQSSIKWEEEDREFSWHDRMYDVVRIVNSGGKRLLYCIQDKKEESLLRHINEVVKTGQPTERKNSRQGSFKIADDFTLLTASGLEFIPAIATVHFPPYTARLLQRPTVAIAPPPRG